MLALKGIKSSHIFTAASVVGLGLGIGFLASRGEWVFALALAALPPLLVLFSVRPFFGVILWLLLMPLSSALPNPELMYWALHRILIPFTLCMSILPHMVKNVRISRPRLGLPEFSVGLMAVYVPISILLGSTDMRLLIKYADRILIPFCVYLIVRFTPLHSREMRFLHWAAFFVAVSQCLIGFVSLIAPQYLPYAWRPLLHGYAAGSLLNPNVYACILGFCICLLFQAVMERKPDFVRFMFIMTCGACVVGIFLSMERAAWLAGAIVLLGLFGLYPKTMMRFALVAAVFMIALGGIFFSRFTSMAVERLRNQGTIDDRLVVSDAMLQMILDRPVFGWGYDNLNNNLENYYRQVGAASANIKFTTSHNTYLTIFTELGLVGFLLYMLPVFWLLTASLRAWRGQTRINPTRWPLLVIFWLASLQIIVISNFMDMRFFPIGFTLWWMTLGLISNLLNQDVEVCDRHPAYQAAQKPVQAYPFDLLQVESNGPKGS